MQLTAANIIAAEYSWAGFDLNSPSRHFFRDSVLKKADCREPSGGNDLLWKNIRPTLLLYCVMQKTGEKHFTLGFRSDLQSHRKATSNIRNIHCERSC